MRLGHHRLTVLPATLALLLIGIACGAPTAAGGSSASTSGDYPLTITNCGVDVTFEEPPERVILLESAPVASLKALGALDSVVLRAGAFPPDYYDAETNAAIQAIPSLGEELDSRGHLQISEEVIISRQPDLVLGLPDGITREGLDSVGIKALVQPTMCPAGVEATTFDDVYEQINTYGRLFDRRARAADLVASLKERVAAIEKAADDQPERTAAVLYPTVGGGVGYAYGNESMAHPQLEAAGFTNVYADGDERVFEVTLEDVLDKDPDVLVLLHVDGDPETVKKAVVGLPGAGALQAVRNDDILVQLFNFTEPPTPLSVDGLETAPRDIRSHLVITAENISFAYGDTVVLDGVRLSAAPGRVVGLIGPNGSGKTTLLRTLYPALAPRAGLVSLDDTPLEALPRREVARRLAVVVQEGTTELPLTVAETVLLGRSPHLTTFQRYSAQDYRIAAAALAEVGARHLADRVFAGLSGGEKQRVLIGRALAQQADHLLLDEPTNHLDIRYQHEVLQLVRALEVTTIVVLHDLNLAARYCDQVVLLERGRVKAAGTPDEVLRPEILEPVYHIGVQRVLSDGELQLLFRPLAPPSPTCDGK